LAIATTADQVHFQEFTQTTTLPKLFPIVLESAIGRFVDSGSVVRKRNRESTETWFDNFAQLAKRCAADYPVMRWAMEGAETRPVSPNTTLTLRDFADRNLMENTLMNALHAQRALPTDGPVQIALGVWEPVGSKRRSYLIQLGISGCEGDVVALQKAFQLLLANGEDSYLSGLAASISQLDATLGELYRKRIP
jgi:hypothetical protein